MNVDTQSAFAELSFRPMTGAFGFSMYASPAVRVVALQFSS
jgi:hypothetical protein